MGKTKFLVYLFLTLSTARAENYTQKIFLKDSKLGREIIEHLNQGDSKENITSQRIEHKAVIPSSLLQAILPKLGIGLPAVPQDQIIQFERRDRPRNDALENSNFTLYGRGIYFETADFKTTIRMRIRIWMEVSSDLKIIQRSPLMPNWAYLEIKIKNPSTALKGGSFKYRIKVYDEDILRLFRADPDARSFDEDLVALERSALNPALKNHPKLVQAMVKAIKIIAKLKSGPNHNSRNIGKDFIKPLFITSYIRRSYSAVEKNYSNNPQALRVEPDKKDVEYQLTIDHQVRAFKPQILDSDTSIDVLRYFNQDYTGPTTSYPDNLVAIEFKVPVEVDRLDSMQRSQIHKRLHQAIFIAMKRNIPFAYQLGRGKAGNLSRKLDPRNQPRWVNENFNID